MSPYHYVQRLSSYRANGNIFDLSLNADARKRRPHGAVAKRTLKKTWRSQKVTLDVDIAAVVVVGVVAGDGADVADAGAVLALLSALIGCMGDA
jgi:hypothetical protein